VSWQAAVVAPWIVFGRLVVSLVAVPLFVIGFLRKIKLEERLLVEHFGDEYRAYRRDVRALIPFVL
jgi:protein-S-isoprenylcysteine O-methyltransferase Ste14